MTRGARPGLFTKEVGGDGSTIVFLHGLGASHRYWQPPFLQLAPRRRLIFLDLLGFGRSPKPDVAYDLEVHVSAIRRSMRDLGVVRSTLIGHSLGALLAIAVGAQNGPQTEHVIAFGLPAYTSPDAARAHLRSLSGMAAMTVDGAWMARAMCYAMGAVRPLASAIAPIVAPTMPAAVARDGVLHSWSSYSGSLRAIIEERRMREWATVLADRLTVVQGIGDVVAPPDEVRDALGAQRVALVVEPGDHHLPLSRPDRSVELISKIIELG